jgi:hypothetical protein
MSETGQWSLAMMYYQTIALFTMDSMDEKIVADTLS